MTDAEDFSVDAARAAAERDELDDWVTRFLSSPGSDNAPLAHKLTVPPRSWLGPIELRIDQLSRLAGPADHPVLEPVEEHEWRDDVDDLAHKVEDGWQPPPMIVTYRSGQLVLEDGNHRAEGLRRTGASTAWSVISFADPEERDRFVQGSTPLRP